MSWRRAAAVIVVAIAASAVTAFLLPHSPSGLRGLLAGAGPVAPLIMLASWILLTPAMFPGTVLAAAGGLAFGAFEGSILAFGGAIVGGLTAFALARTAGRQPVRRFVQGKPRLARSHALLERRGFAAILAARLMPGVPVTALHHAAGVSPVDTRAFAGAIAIGALLRTVPYTILGQGLGSGSVTTILIAFGSVTLGGVSAAILVHQIRRAEAAAV